MNIAPSTSTGEVLRLLVECALKGTVIFSLAALFSIAVKRSSAALRHLIWVLAMGAVLALPILTIVLPSWKIQWLPDWGIQASHDAIAFGAQSMGLVTSNPLPLQTSTAGTTSSDVRSDTENQAASPFVFSRANVQAEPIKRNELTIERRAAASVSASNRPISLSDWIVSIWLGGVVVALSPLVTGWLQLRRITRACNEVSDPEWLELLKDLAAEVGCGRRVELRYGPAVRTPLTWGVRDPVLLLPEEAVTWSANRRRMVLLHELAHIRRWDWFSQTMAHITCALHWFNPFAWNGARIMRVEREQACDDVVLRCGTMSSAYASELLALSSNTLGERMIDWSAVPMARRSSIEQRLRYILDGNCSRAGLSVPVGVVALVLAAALITPVAMMKASPAAQASGGKDRALAKPAQPTVGEQSPDDKSAIAPGPVPSSLTPADRPQASLTNYTQAQREFDRIAELFEQKLVSQSEYDRAKLAADLAQAETFSERDRIGQLKEAYARKNFDRAEELFKKMLISSAEYDAAKSELELAVANRFENRNEITRIKLRRAEQEFSRTKSLAERGLVSLSQLEEAQLKVDVLKAENESSDPEKVILIKLAAAMRKLKRVQDLNNKGFASQSEVDTAFESVNTHMSELRRDKKDAPTQESRKPEVGVEPAGKSPAIQTAAGLHGVVLDFTGKPVDRAEVYVVPNYAGFIHLYDDEVWPADLKTTTDAEGKFVFREIRGTDAMLGVRVGGLVVSQFVSRNSNELVHIQLPQPAKLSVRVDLANRPVVEEVELRNSISWPIRTKSGPEALVVSLLITNGAGSSTVDVAPGSYELSRRKTRLSPDGATGWRNLSLDQTTIMLEAGKTNSVQFVRTNGVAIRGRVAEMSEVPAFASARLFVRPGEASGYPGRQGNAESQLHDVIEVKKDGRFETCRLLPGEYTLAVEVYETGHWRQPSHPGPFLTLYGFTKMTVKEGQAPEIAMIHLRSSYE